MSKIALVTAPAVLCAMLATAPAPAAAQACLQVPVQCQVTSAFGPRFNPITKNFSSEFHHGIDFGCPMGTKVIAAAQGQVDVADFSQSAGNWVRTMSGDGTVLKYMHNERVQTGRGMVVQPGQALALTGNTGRSTGPHLHFQMEQAGKAVDPLARFCSRPALRPGVLDGASVPASDVIDAGSQATAPTDGGGTPPAMGMDGSIGEVIGDLVASRALNPDYARQLSTLSEERLYAELAYQQALKLKVKHERAKHRERTEATLAMLLILRNEQALRPQLEAQRAAAQRASK